MDRESLVCYENGRNVSFEDVKRRLKLLERKSDRTKPDHYYNGESAMKLNGINSLSDLLTKGICRLGDYYLELKNKKVYINPERLDGWQQICCQVTPLIIQCGILYHQLPNSADKASLNVFMKDFLVPNLSFTAIPSPYILDLQHILESTGGFCDLHIHLNGATETDVLWQYALSNANVISKDMDNALRHNRLVKEQAEQEEVNFSGYVMYRRLKRARNLRNEIVKHLFFGDSMPSHSWHPVLSYLGLESFAAGGRLDLPAEALFCLMVMKSLSARKNECLARAFHEYLLILGMLNRFVVQQVYQWGFDQFQKITVNNFRERCELSYYNRFFQWMGADLNYISFIEGRFSPKGTPEKNRLILNSIYKGWKRFLDQYKAYHNLKENKLPDLRLVAHFIKQKDRPYANFSDYATVIRWRSLRADIHNKAVALISCKKHPIYGKYITGADAAANEMDTPPEVFAPVFRMLRNNGIEHFTYHAGEDFHHILSGLRAMVEAVLFLRLGHGDRLGHGTAAGIPVGLWMKRMGNTVYLSKGEWMDNLLFLRYTINTLAPLADQELTSIIPMLECRISDLCSQIYDSQYSCHTLTEAWLMRQYEPSAVMNLKKMDFSTIYKQDYDDSDIEFINSCLADSNIMELVKRYHLKMFRKRYDEIIEVYTSDLLSESVLTKIQEIVLDFLCEKNIVLESLPTSNLRISFYNEFNEHHIERWINPGEKHRCPPVVLGTDDTGIFCTNIYNEYARVYLQLLRKGHTPHIAMSVIKQLDFNSRTYCFD